MFLSFFITVAAFLILSALSTVIVQSQKCYIFVATCPASWQQWGDSCYQVTEKSFTWEEAGDQCLTLGGVLAVPSNLQENDFMVTLISTNAWIGCNDKEREEGWECREGDMVVTDRNWDSGQGEKEGFNNYYEDCAVLTLRSGRKWHDYPCYDRFPAMCKKPAALILEPLQ